MLTWSLGTSRLILTEETNFSQLHYRIYRGDPHDNTYLQSQFNLEDKSITLLQSEKEFLRKFISPATNQVEDKVIGFIGDSIDIKNKLDK